MLKELPPWFAEQRSAGCLLHISSLPSSFGIGNLGKSSYRFIDFLKESGFSFGKFAQLDPPVLEILLIKFFLICGKSIFY